MKKLLVLSLVLGIASLASAALELVPNGTAFTIASDVDGNADLYIIVDEPAGNVEYSNLIGGNLSQSTDYDALFGAPFNPTELGVFGLPTTSAYVKQVTIADSAALLPAGDWASAASLAGTEWMVGEGAVWVVNTADGAVLGTLAVVPEPATLALLGLGALVLRRKK